MEMFDNLIFLVFSMHENPIQSSSIEHGGTRPFSIITVPDGLPAHEGTRPFSIITVPDGLPAHDGTRPFSILWLYRPSK